MKMKPKKEKEQMELASVGQVLSFAWKRSTRLCIVGAFCCAILSGAVYPALAFYFSRAFSDLSRSTNASNFMAGIRRTVYTFMVLGVIMMTATVMQSTLMEYAAAEISRELKQQWFKALLRQDMAYFDIKNIAGQATIVSTNAIKVQKGVGHKLAEAVEFTVSCVGAFAFAFWSSWQVSIVILAVSPFLYFSTSFLVKMTTTQTARANASYATAGAIVSTRVASIRTILSLNAVEKQINLYCSATSNACTTAMNTAWLRGLAFAMQMCSALLSYVILTTFGSYLLYSQIRKTGCDPSGTVEGVATCHPSGQNIFGALMGIQIAASMLSQVATAQESLTEARVAIFPALEVINRSTKEPKKESQVVISKELKGTNDIEAGSLQQDETIASEPVSDLPKYIIDSSVDTGISSPNVKGNISFKNVTFAYPARPGAQVLKTFSLTVPAGKTVALCGPSGSGKSTVVQLVERFYDPLAGSITLDQVDLRELNVKWLREHIGLVLQEPKLFGKSIRDNIALGVPGLTQDRIEEAARLANAHDFIMTFPQGYDTHVGDLGSQLSGGQRQRIALARVLVRKPKILLLDEATSALDSESELVVQEALENLLKLEHFTTIVVAHRLSTIKNADLIAVMDKGTIVETGSHSELLSRRGLYFDLVQAQKTKASPAIVSVSNQKQAIPDGFETCPFDEIDLESPAQEALIQFRDVHFAYPARPDTEVFRGLNLCVYPGETLALVGTSGCGKSTVVQLIEAFYRPSDGAILFRGVDIRDLNIRWLRDEFGLVSQDATLFATSIIENIRYGYSSATMEQVVEVAKQANCHEFMTEFPDGYQTQIGEGSNLVSGGQKQRIAIARALIKKPKVLLLDEATSSLDSEGEKIVQQSLDMLMANKEQTCIVIAHRLSTIGNADRIAVIDDGKVCEIGTHDELMTRPDGRYRRLQEMQNLDETGKGQVRDRKSNEASTEEKDREKQINTEQHAGEEDISKEEAKKNAKRVKFMGLEDKWFILVGIIGALLAGIMFPAWGFVFAYMIDLIYQHVGPCAPEQSGLMSCQSYWDSIADAMQHTSILLLYTYIGLAASAFLGDTAVYWGFGAASERMNKRVRDAAFTSLIRQEVAWFDLQSPGSITSRLEDDAALLHAFSGTPIRVLAVSLSSVLVGLGVSFYFMWPFALLVLLLIPFMTFGAKMKMKMFLGEDEVIVRECDQESPGGILIETFSNMRTVASLTLEEYRWKEYSKALKKAEPNTFKTNFGKGVANGLGQLVQMWSLALMFWWGGWLLFHYSGAFTYRGYLISMWALFISTSGLAIAAEGTVDHDDAKKAASRIFLLTDRKSAIDPLNKGGQTLANR